MAAKKKVGKKEIMARVSPARLNVREAPSMDAVIMEVIERGTEIRIIDPEETNGFVLTEKGWVMLQFLSLDK